MADDSNKAGGPPQGNEARPGKNLMDLLCLSTKAAEANPSENKGAAPLDENSKEFLNAALSSMTINVKDQLLGSIHAIENLLKAPQVTDEECEQAFEVLLDLVDQIDYANDFCRLGGFRIFGPCLSSSTDGLKWRCCELIARICQNNPFCQDACLREGYLGQLCKILNEKEFSDKVRLKAAHAISCLVRGSEACLKELMKFHAADGTECDGLSTICFAFHGDVPMSWRLDEKLSFMVSAFYAMMTQEQKGYFAEKYLFQFIVNLARFKDPIPFPHDVDTCDEPRCECESYNPWNSLNTVVEILENVVKERSLVDRLQDSTKRCIEKIRNRIEPDSPEAKELVGRIEKICEIAGVEMHKISEYGSSRATHTYHHRR